MKLSFLSKYLRKQATRSKNVAFRKLYWWTIVIWKNCLLLRERPCWNREWVWRGKYLAIDVWWIGFILRERPCWSWEWAWRGECLATRASEAALSSEESWSGNLAAIEEAGLDWSKLSQPLLSEASGGSRALGESLTAAQATTHQGGLGNITLGLREDWGHLDTYQQKSRNHFHLSNLKVMINMVHPSFTSKKMLVYVGWIAVGILDELSS